MANIGFTKGHEDTYNRFQQLRRETETKLGRRVYAWELLEWLMDLAEPRGECKEVEKPENESE